MGTVGSDDYYALLGVDVDAPMSDVRRAWRRLALQWHPDRAGPSAAETFKQIAAAYAVLCDPTARATYDRKRGVTRPAKRARSTMPDDDAPAPRKRAPGVMLSRLTGSLRALQACGVARRADDGVIELSVNDEEAARGGMASISMNVAVRCPACRGRAKEDCPRCKAKGSIMELFSAWLAIPPDVADDTMLAPSAQLPGVLRSVFFRIRRR